MRVVYTYDVEDLEKIQGIIKGYNPKVIPNITTQINHIRENNKVRLRVAITGEDNAVQNLVNLLNQ